MKKELIFVLIVGLALLLYDYQRPTEPGEVYEVRVVSLADAPRGSGWRLITVELPDGTRRMVETLAPFFYKPGYPAYIGVYRRKIFADIYDFVAESENQN